MHTLPRKQTIPHLEGLRGVAIIMVLLFHCFHTFRNGYLGVDIFLVVSGYLLFRKFWDDDEPFDVASFLLKKVQRLFPLAVCVSVLCCAVALFLFPADLILKTAKAAFSTLIGCSNVYFDYTFSDYFSTGVRLNPLVHTWYLSLIAQIYLIYAIIARCCRKRKKIVKIFIVGTVSFVSVLVYYLPLWLPCISPLTFVPSTYYWTSGRLWMVFAGAMAHFLPIGRGRRFVGGFSCLLLLIMGFSIHAWGPWGVMAEEIMTVICSCMVVVYGGSSAISALLCRRIVRVIGRYSFSLYIIHWPIIVFSFYIASAYSDVVPLSVKVAALLASFSLAVLLYHRVEKRKVKMPACAGMMLLGCVVTWSLIITDGLPTVIHSSVNAVSAKNYAGTDLHEGPLYESLPSFRQETHHGGFGSMQNYGETIPLLYGIGAHPENADFLLIGDSHAEALYPGFDVWAKKGDYNGAYLHTYVIPLDDVYSEYRPYQRWDREKCHALYEYLKRNKQIKTVFIANFLSPRFGNCYVDWKGEKRVFSESGQYNYTCFYNFLKRVRETGKKIVVFTDVPKFGLHDLQVYVKCQLLYGRPIDVSKLTCSRDDYEKSNAGINEQLARWEKEGLCTVLHPETVLFTRDSFCCFQQNELLYMDGDHLSLDGSIMCIQSMEDELKTILSPK